MFTLTAFLGSLPPASLAAADLPRFATRALNRRKREDLPGVRELLRDEPLSGYPSTLSRALLVLVDRLVAEGMDPAGLDPETVERLWAAPQAVDELSRLDAVELTVLRPGMAVTAEIRDLVGERAEIVPGAGPQLVLVAPARVLRMPGLGWSALQSPVLARLMSGEEAASLRDAWATLEEYTGWPRPRALPWEARFVRIATRSNLDGRRVVESLRALSPTRRTILWRAVIEHLRDRGLPEGHRPGRKGLERRLADADVRWTEEDLDVLVPFGAAMVGRCGEDPLVARGLCPCTAEDLEAYTGWVEISDAARRRLRALEPAMVEHHLRILAAVERGALEAQVDPGLQRDLRGLRDGFLRHRYRRDVTPLWDVDPLPLAEARLAAGEDREVIVEELARLAQTARREGVREAEAAERPQAPRPPGADAASERPPSTGGAEPAPEAAPSPPPESPSPKPRAADANPFSTRPARPPRDRMPTVPPPADLPPMPEPPPPRHRPITRQARELPPIPKAPEVRRPKHRRRTITTDRPLDVPPRRPRSSPPEAQAPRAPAASPEQPATRPVRPPRRPADREGTVPHLTTPGQATAFYQEAFRELEVFERDLLERGPWPEAERRVGELGDRADELADALGPPARSGDADFRAALHKVELVRSYLVRIRPLLDPDRPLATDDDPEPEFQPGVLGRLGRLFKREE